MARMTLKTYTGYPEVHIDGVQRTFKWTARILAGDGQALAVETGTAETHDQARDAAAAWVKRIQDGFLRDDTPSEATR